MASRADYERQRYNTRKMCGLCYRCGADTDGIHLSCDRCREKIRLNNHKYKGRYEYQYNKKAWMEEKPKETTHKYTLDELSRMAVEQGISYGVLVAKMEVNNNAD